MGRNDTLLRRCEGVGGEMKIVATVTNTAHVVHAGGDVDRTSVVIDLGDNLPQLLKSYLKNAESNDGKYETISFSILSEKT
jgi:hypothetical protein